MTARELGCFEMANLLLDAKAEPKQYSRGFSDSEARCLQPAWSCPAEVDAFNGSCNLEETKQPATTILGFVGFFQVMVNVQSLLSRYTL